MCMRKTRNIIKSIMDIEKTLPMGVPITITLAYVASASKAPLVCTATVIKQFPLFFSLLFGPCADRMLGEKIEYP
jgi:hypothetical protein